MRGLRSRGRQRLRWSDVVKKEMEVKGAQEEDAWDNKSWRKKIKIMIYPENHCQA